MNKEDKFNLLLRIAYRIFTSIFFVSIGLGFMLVPALAKQDTHLHAVFEGLDIGMGIPMAIVLVGLATMLGVLDFLLDYCIGVKDAFKKGRK